MSIVPPHDPMDPTAPRLTDLEPEAEERPFLTPEAAAEELPPQARHIEGRSPWLLAWQRLRRDRVAMVSLVIIVLIILMAIFAPVTTALTSHPPNEQYRETGLSADGLPLPPNSTFWLGTDDLGRDIFVRIAYGSRVSLLVGVAATLLTVIIGVFSWASVARIVRGQVLSLREREFVEAARSLGASDRRIMFVDIMPNILAPIIVYASLLIPVVIVVEATLSYLGLGLAPPTADWGGMISEAQNYYTTSWWFVVFPGAALLLTTLAFNLLGDGIRDAFDPRSDRLLAK